ncbi:hypothetical protein MPL3365_80125 [Mesorhizobium plurifarium]|uniref:Uncharacterized protein n=1 Tax=Mesorhizobium plurifarium TaxID=69974 RepID=A0A090GDZ7_MESPL|nr:hypothetical protein MPL3365_80125 [Mesorhizobium plurifarium]
MRMSALGCCVCRRATRSEETSGRRRTNRNRRPRCRLPANAIACRRATRASTGPGNTGRSERGSTLRQARVFVPGLRRVDWVKPPNLIILGRSKEATGADPRIHSVTPAEDCCGPNKEMQPLVQQCKCLHRHGASKSRHGSSGLRASLRSLLRPWMTKGGCAQKTIPSNSPNSQDSFSTNFIDLPSLISFQRPGSPGHRRRGSCSI